MYQICTKIFPYIPAKTNPQHLDTEWTWKEHQICVFNVSCSQFTICRTTWNKTNIL